MKSVAAGVLPARALNVYLSALGSADYHLGRDTRERCRPLLADHLKVPPRSSSYEFYLSQLCRNLVRWSVPLKHAYWRDSSIRYEWVCEQNIRRCLADGRGVIILQSHFGPWPSTVHEFERHGLRMELTYPLGWPHMSRFDPEARLEFLRRARRILSNNGIVALMGDVGIIGLNQGLGRVVELPFLGMKMPFPLGCARLSALTSSPIVPIFSLRQADGRHFMICTEPIESSRFEGSESERAVQMMACYASRLEEMVKAYPHNASSYLEFAHRARAA
ncbi:MAG TPA: lysophospholipid acyltransferase family protein [Pyrinomonadaceae bacterium]